MNRPSRSNAPGICWWKCQLGFDSPRRNDEVAVVVALDGKREIPFCIHTQEKTGWYTCIFVEDVKCVLVHSGLRATVHQFSTQTTHLKRKIQIQADWVFLTPTCVKFCAWNKLWPTCTQGLQTHQNSSVYCGCQENVSEKWEEDFFPLREKHTWWSWKRKTNIMIRPSALTHNITAAPNVTQTLEKKQFHLVPVWNFRLQMFGSVPKQQLVWHKIAFSSFWNVSDLKCDSLVGVTFVCAVRKKWRQSVKQCRRDDRLTLTSSSPLGSSDWLWATSESDLEPVAAHQHWWHHYNTADSLSKNLTSHVQTYRAEVISVNTLRLVCLWMF